MKAPKSLARLVAEKKKQGESIENIILSLKKELGGKFYTPSYFKKYGHEIKKRAGRLNRLSGMVGGK